MFWVDDLPDDWLDEVKAFGFKWSLSPLHDKDLWTEDDEKKNPERKAGMPKKKHHHAIFMFPSQKTHKQMCELFGGVFGFGDSETSVKGVQFQKCDSVSGSVQYFAHLNHPKKTQYDTADIQGFNGFDVEKYLKHDPTQEETREMLIKIEQIIKDYQITELVELTEILSCEPDKMYLDAVKTTHRAYFRDYLYSMRGMKIEEQIIQKFMDKHGLIINPVTGKVIFRLG
jgi:hypothetical protein